MSKENEDNYFNLGILVYYFDIIKSGETTDEKYMQSGIRFENQLDSNKINKTIQSLPEGRYEFRIVLNTDNSHKIETIDSEEIKEDDNK
jgi:hypothetical protein